MKVNASFLCGIKNALEELSEAVVIATVKGMSLSALLDTGSSYSFIHEQMAKKSNLKSQPANERVTTAQSILSAASGGRCRVEEMFLQKRCYSDVPLLVVHYLCCDLLLGQDFMRQHEAIKILFRGTGTALEIKGHPKHCAVARVGTNPPSLFPNLAANCKPITVQSRLYRKEDRTFIEIEGRPLSAEGIIAESVSPWWAQVLIVKDRAAGKKKLCVDYSDCEFVYRYFRP